MTYFHGQDLLKQKLIKDRDRGNLDDLDLGEWIHPTWETFCNKDTWGQIARYSESLRLP